MWTSCKVRMWMLTSSILVLRDEGCTDTLSYTSMNFHACTYRRRSDQCLPHVRLTFSLIELDIKWVFFPFAYIARSTTCWRLYTMFPIVALILCFSLAGSVFSFTPVSTSTTDALALTGLQNLQAYQANNSGYSNCTYDNAVVRKEW